MQQNGAVLACFLQPVKRKKLWQYLQIGVKKVNSRNLFVKGNWLFTF
jgi:hypothetical protein